MPWSTSLVAGRVNDCSTMWSPATPRPIHTKYLVSAC